MHRKEKTIFLKEKIKKTTYMHQRFFILCSFVFVSLIILTLRIIFLQIINSDPLILEGDRRTSRIQSLLSTRGIIHDRSGYPFAVTVSVNAICADPSKIANKQNIQNDLRWKALSEILSIPLKKIIFNINNHLKSKFIYLARQITPEIGEYIKKLKLPGIFLLEESKRYYPSGKIAAQLIGITNIDGIGIEGVEKSFNKVLTGKPGKRKIRRDNKGQVIENISLVNKCESNSLTLSVDKKIANYCISKIKRRS
jgi:cell division protein FtsI (penicillin-binding protein 3)